MEASIVVLGDHIPETLQRSLDSQTFRDFEVILAPEEGIVNAMNIALHKAKGKILVRIDTDVKMKPWWLGELLKPFSDPRVCGTTGPTLIPKRLRKNRLSIKMAEKPNWFLRWMFDNDPYAPAKIYKCGSVSYGSNFREQLIIGGKYKIDHLEGTNWAMRTSLIREVGGFDPAFDGVAEWFDDDVLFKVRRLCQDLDHTLVHHGKVCSADRIVYCKRATLFHLIGEPTMNFDHRNNGWGRIKNWLRFHHRHSKFHYKKVIWLGFLVLLAFYMQFKKRRGK